MTSPFRAEAMASAPVRKIIHIDMTPSTRQPARHLAQDSVSRPMPESVVDQLETVKVDEQDGETGPEVAGGSRVHVEELAEADPVRQFG